MRRLLLLLAALLLPAAAHATCPVVPFVFTQGNPIDAPHLNTNFSTLRDCITSFAFIQNASNTTAVRNLQAGIYPILLRDYNAVVGDGTGIYYWNAGSNCTDDATTCIKPASNPAVGRWLLGQHVSSGERIEPAAGTANPAINATMNLAGSGPGVDKFFNPFIIASDAYSAAQTNLIGLGVDWNCCTTSAQGWRFGIGGRIDVTTAWSAADPEPVFVGMLGNARASVAASSAGAYLGGGNSNVQLGTGATGWNQATGHEIDNQVFAGAGAPQVKTGLSVVLGALDAQQGFGIDAGIHFTAAGTSPGYLNLMLIDSGFGAQPIATTGTIIGMRNAATFADGFDFTLATITANLLTGPGGNSVISGLGDAFFNGLTRGVGNTTSYPESFNGWALTTSFASDKVVYLWNTDNAGAGIIMRQKTGAAAGQNFLTAAADSGAASTTNLGIRVTPNGGGATSLQGISTGADNGCGGGFRCLRVPN